MNKLFLMLLSTLMLSPIYSQNIRGKIVDNSNAPIIYANIGVKGQNIGTVSDENGNFDLDLTTLKEDSKITISNISYKTKEYTIKDFISLINAKKQIILEESYKELDEVVITSKKLKKDNLGNKTTSKMIETGFNNSSLGREIGIKIKIKDKPTYIDSFNFCIISCKYDSLFFRLNIYSIKDDMPFENLLPENIYFSTNIKEGKVSIDLTKYNIVVNQDVIITIEYIKELGKESVTFSSSLFGNKLYFRPTSYSEWVKEGTISLGFNIDVRH